MELIGWLIFAALTIVPLMKLLPHFGIHQYWAFVSIIPLGGIALLWWMAMKLQDMDRR